MVMSASADSGDLVSVPGPSTSSETHQQNPSELTLIDYFVVAGYDATVGLQVVSSVAGLGSNVGNSLSCPPLEQSYVASIQVHYPESRKGRPFPSEILSLCLPKGLRFYTQSNVPHHEVHTFANIREDGVRLDGTALIFYEEVTDQQLCQKMAELQAEHVKALTAQDKTSERAHLPPGTVSGGTHTLPRSNKKDRHKRTSFYDSSRNSPLYVSKCICVVTRIPVVSSTTHLLNALYEMIKSSTEPSLPLESYIYWMLNEVPLPAPGSTLKVCLSEVDIVLQRPAPGELPFFDYSLNSLFSLIIVDKFLRLFSCFLLEHQILLCSKSLSRLMLVAESLCLLAFPFRWQLTYVPILPYSQLKFMEAPVPYIMGLCYEEEIPEQIFQSNVCVFDIDTGELEMPEDVPLIPDRSEMAREVATVLARFEEQNSSSGTRIMSREANKSTNRHKEEWSSKRMSRSFDDDALAAMCTERDDDSMKPSRKGLTPLPLDDVLKQSEVLARVAAIARRAGVDVQMEKIERELQSNDSYTNSPVCRRYFSEMKLNNAIREIFLNRFAWLLYSYEHFVITANNVDKDLYFASRDSVVNFDKAAFLSDQPDSNLPFLAAFLETQMFASFVDAKIVSQWETPDQNLQLFDARIQTLKEIHGLQMVRTPTYEKALPMLINEEAISKREETLDYIVPQPHALAGICSQCYNGKFPELNGTLLEGNKSYTPQPSPWKQRHRRLRPKFQKESSLNDQTNHRSSAYFSDSPKQIAQQNLKFVDQLLKETKAKTKRMLVEKMGKEAVQLGHAEANVNGLEENTLVASFCDLLERVWAHGLLKKQGKSSLWAHVLHHQELEKTGSFAHPASVRNSLLAPDIENDADEAMLFAKEDRSALTELARSIQKELEGSAGPAWSVSILRAANFICDKISSASNAVQPTATVGTKEEVGGISPLSSIPGKLGRSHSLQLSARPSLHKTSSFNGLDFTPNWSSSVVDEHGSTSPRKRITARARSPDVRYGFPPLPTHIAYDLKNVLRMTEIKTDLGFARAFVRLSLERKLLHRHLKTILSNTTLLHQIYKRYAFLRCEDEKEQFLYHILSLNAAEFRCFTNTFCKTKMQYRVLLATGNSRSVLTTPIWVQLAGSLCSTTAIEIIPGVIDFKFDHVNLGILSTLRIGRSIKDVNNATSSKWYLDYALVRNEVTGQTYQFNCGRWFGRDVDDGSLERLLVAEVLPQVDPDAEETGQFQNGYFERSKSHSRSATPTRARSPSASRSEILNTKSKSRLTEIQRQLGEAVNAIVKHLYSGSKSCSDLTPLLCAPDKGLVSVMVSVFLYGRQDSSWSSRFFKHYYPWDYIEKVCGWFSDLLRTEDAKRLTREQRKLILYACCLVRRIGSNTSLGKDGKFQLFIIITLRDHILAGLLPLMARTPVTAQLYEEPSFLRSPHYLSYLSKLLNSLNEFQFSLEKSLTYGLE